MPQSHTLAQSRCPYPFSHSLPLSFSRFKLSGPPIEDKKSSLLRERGRFSPTRYFMEEVITGFDETDLHRSWARDQATRSPQERNTRLENMCWRIWNLARQKKQLFF